MECLRCQDNQGQRDGIANQARQALTARPDSRRGERWAARKGCSRKKHLTKIFFLEILTWRIAVKRRTVQTLFRGRAGTGEDEPKKGLGNPEPWEPSTQFHYTYHCDVCLHKDGYGPEKALKEERIRTGIQRKTFIYIWARSAYLLSPCFSPPHYMSAVALKRGRGPNKYIPCIEFQPWFSLSLSFSLTLSPVKTLRRRQATQYIF